MRIDDVGVKRRWTDDDKAKLRKLHSECSEESKSFTFLDNLTKLFGTSRTMASIADECRRLGLAVKRNPKTDNCDEDVCKVELTKANRVGNKCRRCYYRLYFKTHKGKPVT